MIRAAAIVLALWAGSASAQGETARAAREAAVALNAAADMLSTAQTRRDRVAALTETVRAYEDGLVTLRDGLRRVAIRRQAIEAELAARSDEVSELLGVLQSMSRAQSPVLMLHPTGPLGTARSGMILADVTPALQAEVERLRADLEEVQALQSVQDDAARTLHQGLAGAQTARLALSTAISERTDLPQRFSEDPAKRAELLASTETLAAFANGLAAIVDQEFTGTVPDARALRGQMPLPVQGRILRRFAEPDAAGIVRPGWVIAVRPRALVSTPVAATVRFQGPLLDYGNVIILEPAADVLFVISGLAEVFGEAGQILPAGSPVGLVGGEQPSADAILTADGGGNAGSRTQTLYLEVREGQSAIDPGVWFAGTE